MISQIFWKWFFTFSQEMIFVYISRQFFCLFWTFLTIFLYLKKIRIFNVEFWVFLKIRILIPSNWKDICTTLLECKQTFTDFFKTVSYTQLGHIVYINSLLNLTSSFVYIFLKLQREKLYFNRLTLTFLSTVLVGAASAWKKRDEKFLRSI